MHRVLWHRCAPLSNAAQVRGCLALIDRGEASAGSCPYPNVYFANKILVAQQVPYMATTFYHKGNHIPYIGGTHLPYLAGGRGWRDHDEQSRRRPGQHGRCLGGRVRGHHHPFRLRDAGIVAIEGLCNGADAIYGVNIDASEDIAIPSVFVTQERGNMLKAELGHGLRGSFSKPQGRRPLLAPGIPMHGTAAENQIRYFELWT